MTKSLNEFIVYLTPMKNDQCEALRRLLGTPKRIAIIPHKNPDGDAIGSCLAMWHYLTRKGHSATVISPNNYPEFLKWLPGESQIIKFDVETERATGILKASDIVFTLDFNTLDRVGEMEPFMKTLKAPMVMIDHHPQPQSYATYMFSDTDYSSTCEMVYDLLVRLGDSDHIDQAVATSLYTGIVTDSGSFRFPSTSSHTHRVAADLLERGVENSKVHEQLYDTFSIDRLHLLGCALKNLVVLKEYCTAYITLSKEELLGCNYQKGDTEGFVNYGLSLRGIQLAAIFIENAQEPMIKISFRSKGDFSVNEMARSHFNGGGHANAAGGRSDMPLEETVAKFRMLLPTYQEKLCTL